MFAPLVVTLSNQFLQLFWPVGKPSLVKVVLPAPLTEKPMTKVFTFWLPAAAFANLSATAAALFGYGHCPVGRSGSHAGRMSRLGAPSVSRTMYWSRQDALT